MAKSQEGGSGGKLGSGFPPASLGGELIIKEGDS